MKSDKLVKKIRKNINFLDRPLFFPTKKIITRYDDGNGYIITGAKGLPNNFDIILLNNLLYKSQKTNQSTIYYADRAELIREIGYTDSKNNYEAIKESLEKLQEINIRFEKSFYTKRGMKISIKELHILDGFELEKKDEDIKIMLGQSFCDLNIMRFSRSIPLQLINSLSSTTKRLFEILIKNFHIRNEWSIFPHNLRNKIPLDVGEDWIIRDRTKKALVEINKEIINNNYQYFFEMAVEKVGKLAKIIFTKRIVGDK